MYMTWKRIMAVFLAGIMLSSNSLAYAAEGTNIEQGVSVIEQEAADEGEEENVEIENVEVTESEEKSNEAEDVSTESSEAEETNTENDAVEIVEAEEADKDENDTEEEAEPDEVTAELAATYLQWLEYPTATYAASTGSYATELAKFPSDYQTLLKELHKSYPNWIFVAVDTGLDWDDVVAGESYGTRSLIQKTYSSILLSNASGDYNASTGAYTIRDGSTWVNASDPAIAYFVDPRNYLNKQYIFAMEVQSYDASCHTLDGVENILSGTDLANKVITYTNTSGKTVSLSPLTYGQAILAAGASSGVSPLFLASKIKQETGGGLSNGSISGNFSYNGTSYMGYYNFYNIGAYATSTGSAVANGLAYAKNSGGYQRPWNSPVKAIQGGAEYLASSYISRGQNTGYLQKFNTVYKPYYSYQYMQNISAAMSEGRTTYNSYNSLGIMNSSFVFYIPVYKNMPSRTESVKISKSDSTATTLYSVNVRKGPSTSYGKVTTIPKGETVTVSGGVFTDDTVTVSNKLTYPYWVKVTYGEYEGYISADYIQMNTSISVKKGYTSTIKLSSAPSGETIYYETSDPAVATVNSNGVITGVGSGTCMIYAITSSGQAMDAVGVKVTTTLSKPTLVSASNTSSGVKVTWKATSGAEGYYIYRKTSGGSYSKIGTVTSGTTVTYIDTTAKSGTTYIYTVKAYGGGSTSSYNSTGLTVLRLAQPSLVSVTAVNSSKLKLTWNKVTGAEGYYIYRKVSGGSWSRIKTITSGSTVSFTNYYLNSNTTYYYTVRAYAGSYTSTRSSTGISGKTSEASYTTYYTTHALNYRTGPGTTYSKVGTLSKGSSVQIETGYQKKVNGTVWHRAKINSKTYYLSSVYLTETVEKTYTAYRTTVKLNYRTGAGTSYTAAGTLESGTIVQVEDGYSKSANGYTWYRIKINSKNYYVSSVYLTKIKYSNYTTTSAVNYRTGAGTSYSKAGTIAQGNTVQVEDGYSVSADGYTWYRVKINSKYYYVVAKYLKKA